MTNDYLDNKQLFNDILMRNYFLPFKQGNKRFEIFLKGSCNNGCNYCYLGKYHQKLYPMILEQDQDKLIHNFDLIIDWYIKNHFISEIDIFSGEWVSTPFGPIIFEHLYSKFKEVPFVYRPRGIVIPDSMKFLNDDDRTELIQNYIDKFKELNIPVFFSASIDGPYSDNDLSEKNLNFYHKCQIFCFKNNFGLHPMVSSKNIKTWIDNYNWFKETFSEDFIHEQLYMLEVRDETWTEENFQDYIKFLNYLIDDKMQYFNNDKVEFLKFIFRLEKYRNWQNQLIQTEDRSVFYNRDKVTCSIQDTLHIRVGDLALGLCHRLYYEELLIGKLLTNDDNTEIVDIDVINVALQIVKDHMKKSCLPICENCSLVNLCPGHCWGNGYENFKNFLIPPKEVCELFKAKYGFLFYKYNQLGLYQLLQDTNLLERNKSFESYILDLNKNFQRNFN